MIGDVKLVRVRRTVPFQNSIQADVTLVGSARTVTDQKSDTQNELDKGCEQDMPGNCP